MSRIDLRGEQLSAAGLRAVLPRGGVDTDFRAAANRAFMSLVRTLVLASCLSRVSVNRAGPFRLTRRWLANVSPPASAGPPTPGPALARTSVIDPSATAVRPRRVSTWRRRSVSTTVHWRAGQHRPHRVLGVRRCACHDCGQTRACRHRWRPPSLHASSNLVLPASLSEANTSGDCRWAYSVRFRRHLVN
jgi:hypothetical protein